jgi:hypothetical protein
MEDQRDADDVVTVADLGRYQNYTGLVIVFVIFERFLMDVLNTADSEIDNNIKHKEREFRNWKDYVKEFHGRLSVDLEAEPFSSLGSFREIRNKIVHQGAQTLGAQGRNGYEPGSEIPISEADVERCMDLVQTCCAEIHQKFMNKARPHLEETARLQDAWDPFGEGESPTTG